MRIEAGNASGDIWQAIHRTETIKADSVQDAAEWTAQNQNISNGGVLRIAVWDGTDTSAEPTYIHHGPQDEAF